MQRQRSGAACKTWHKGWVKGALNRIAPVRGGRSSGAAAAAALAAGLVALRRTHLSLPRAMLQATAEIIEMADLSSDAVAGPLRARAAAHRRHTSVLQLRGLLQQLVDALALVTLADEALGAKAACRLPPSERHIVLAVGAQVRPPCWRAQLQLPPAQACYSHGGSLRTPLHHCSLASACAACSTWQPSACRWPLRCAHCLHWTRCCGSSLRPRCRRCSGGRRRAPTCCPLQPRLLAAHSRWVGSAAPGRGPAAHACREGWARRASQLPRPPAHAPPSVSLMQLRSLYHTLALALMPQDAAALKAAEAELAAGSAGLAAIDDGCTAAMAATQVD